MQVNRILAPGVRSVFSMRAGTPVLLAFFAMAAFSSFSAEAQSTSKKADAQEIPKAAPMELETADGLQLGLTYYASLKGKQAIPVVLLHGWKENSTDYSHLAIALQKEGYAVIVPDLRGHGESTRLQGARRDETLDAARLTAPQFRLMVGQDMVAVKKFLWDKNNEGKLNIDKLCVIGAEMGASVALEFAHADAYIQDVNRIIRPEYKLGRFVKALVLLSPKVSFPGLPARGALSYPAVQRDMAVLILVGKEDARAMEDAKRIHGMFEKHHPEPTGDNKNDLRTLFFARLETNLQGTKLLDPKLNLPITLMTPSDGAKQLDPQVTVPMLISDFLRRRLVKSEESRDWTWRVRKLPHQ